MALTTSVPTVETEDWLREKCVKLRAMMVLEGLRSITCLIQGPEVTAKDGKTVATRYSVSISEKTVKVQHEGDPYGIERRLIYDGPTSWLRGVIDYEHLTKDD